MNVIEEIIKKEEQEMTTQKPSSSMGIEDKLKEFRKHESKFIPSPYSTKTNQEKFDAALWFIDSLYNSANELIEKNIKLKAYANERSNEEIFADKNKEIEELKEEIRKLYYRLAQSFSIEEANAISAWYTQHLLTADKSIPHTLTFNYTPTPIDDCLSADCSCGASYDIWR